MSYCMLSGLHSLWKLTDKALPSNNVQERFECTLSTLQNIAIFSVVGNFEFAGIAF